MKRIEKIIIFWGVCDLAFFAIYTISSFASGEVPFCSNFTQAINNIKNFGNSWSFIAITFLSIGLYLSIPISGILLILRKRMGALLAYCQTPFRIGMVAPSVYFIFWLIGRIEETPLIIGALIAILSEIIKIYTLIKWQRIIQNPANHAFHSDGNSAALHCHR
jgi:hypothetical protein